VGAICIALLNSLAQSLVNPPMRHSGRLSQRLFGLSEFTGVIRLYHLRRSELGFRSCAFGRDPGVVQAFIAIGPLLAFIWRA
jgi:hypothetical protein